MMEEGDAVIKRVEIEEIINKQEFLKQERHISINGKKQHGSLKTRPGKRRQGYRIKRPSAGGGCLGDHRRRKTRQPAKSCGELANKQ